MKCRWLPVLLATSLLAGASPADALKIQQGYERAMDKWSVEMNAAATPEAKDKIWKSRPDATPYARDLWVEISGNLDQDWTLDAAAWFLRVTPGLLARDAAGIPQPVFARENDALRKAIETHHLASKKIKPVCESLAVANDPRSVMLLEKIREKNPDPAIQGVAAMAAAMQLKALGEGADIMARRLTNIRIAVKQAATIQLNGTPVADLAKEELYIITNLTKGREAPDLIGKDTAGRAMSLSAHAGKVIVLLFWNSNVIDAKRTVEVTNAMQLKYKGEPVAIIGVNNDTTEKLRSLQADNTVPWPNFTDPDNSLARIYRVGNWPLAYVLDSTRKVQYAGAPGSIAEAAVDGLLIGMKKAGAPPKK